MNTSLLTLLWSHAKLAVWIAFVVLGALLYIEHDRHVRDTALADAHLSSLHHTEAVLRDSITVAKGTVFRDTVRLTRVVRDYQTAHDTAVIHLTDTVLVKAALEKADTAVKACRVTVLDCANLNRLLTTRLANADSQVMTLGHLIPSRTQRVVTAGKWLVVGAGLYAILSHTVGR